MRKKNILFLMCLLLAFPMWAQEQREVKLKLVQTSDVHGNYYPYDFIVGRDAAGSLFVRTAGTPGVWRPAGAAGQRRHPAGTAHGLLL